MGIGVTWSRDFPDSSSRPDMSSAYSADSTHDPRAPALRTLVVCDLVGSTALVEQLGDLRAALLVQRHDRIARDLVAACHGREIDKTDGFLLVFDRAVHAIEFALRYMEQLAALAERERVELAVRVGVHVGEVIEWRNTAGDIAQGAKPIEVEGIAKPVAARLMNMALPGQVLVSGVAQALARRAQDELGVLARGIVWREHGNFKLKGVAEPIIVWEVTDRGAPMRALPVDGSKAQRLLPWWRRRAVQLGALALLAGLLVVVHLARRESPPQPLAFTASDWVALGDVRDLTGIEGIGATVGGALRIALEQSDHMSLLGVLAQRDALARMGREAHVPIDRTTGAELAVREGVALLVLPTVADVGGRLRVTLELVDPATETTMHALSAEAASVDELPALVDELARQLRAWLGEDVAQLRQGVRPLARVATANLDALRAYTLAIEAEASLAPGQAKELLARALELDPGFSRARLALARLQLATGDAAGFDSAIAGFDGTDAVLAPRDRLLLDALRAEAHAPATAADRWAALVALYPDTADARASLVRALWHYEGRLAEARAIARAAAAPRGSAGARPVPAHALLDLAAGDPAAALASLGPDDARSFARTLVEAQVRTAADEPDLAATLLEQMQIDRDPAQQFALREAKAVQSLASGSLGALVAVEGGFWRDRLADPLVASAADVALAAQLRIVAALRGAAGAGDLAALRESQVSAARSTLIGPVRLDHAVALGLLGAVAVRQGDVADANAVATMLDDVPAELLTGCLVDLRDALALRRGAVPRRSGTIETWAAAAREGGSITWRSAVAARARSAGRLDLAYAVAVPLSMEIGHAMAEQCGSIPLRLVNVHDVRMGALEAAELAVEVEAGQAHVHLRRFLSHWPETQLPPFLLQRVQQVRAESLRRGAN
jgi:putative peptide modification system cyclase